MIVICQRKDLAKVHQSLPAEKVKSFHIPFSERAFELSELIVFIEDSKVYVLFAKLWPAGKPMSAAELLQYIAEHAV